jgi:hypothetical protein
MARPSKYNTHIKPYIDNIAEWIRNGELEDSIAKRLGINKSTWYDYKIHYPELRKKVIQGQQNFNDKGGIKIKDSVLKSVYTTTDYSKFKFFDWNRNTNRKHIEVLKKSIEAGEVLNPILISPDFYVLDGQHRLVAKKELERPIQYIINDTTCEEEYKEIIHAINSKSLKWSMFDYVIAYAKSGNEHYKFILDLKEKYPEFKSNSNYILIASSKTESNIGKQGTIISGNLIIENKNLIHKTINMLLDFKETICFPHNRFIMALIQFFKIKDYHHMIMLSKIKSRPGSIYACNTVTDYKKMLLAAYNYATRNSMKINLPPK